MLYPNGTTIKPAVSSPFGPRTGGAFSFHYGADLVGYATVRAAGGGKVTFAGWLNNAAGNTVYISYGGGVTEVHMHLASFAVRKGEWVDPGDALGQMGRTGNASGNCDHFEIRINGTSVEPLAYTAARLGGSPAGGGTTIPTTTTPTTPIIQEDDMLTIFYASQTDGSKPDKGRVFAIFRDPRNGQLVKDHIKTPAVWEAIKTAHVVAGLKTPDIGMTAGALNAIPNWKLR